LDRVLWFINKIQRHDSTERFCGLGAEVRFGQPAFINDHVVEVGGDRISAKAWIVSTGSSPALPPVEGLAAVPYWTNETVFSQRTLPSHLLVLGGGPIGLEMAQAFQRIGSHVTVVEFMEQILGPEDVDIAQILRSRLEQEGMRILTSTKAVKAESSGSTIRLTIGPGKGEGSTRVLEADALIVATGRKPNAGDLGLDAAGVAFNPRGIPTDARMRTNIRHIYACGDVNGQFPFTHVAGYEAGIALSNVILRVPRKSDYTKVAWCTYTDPEIASIGLNEKRAKKDEVEYRVFEEEFSENDRALAEGEELGKIKVLISPKGRVLGCQIIGPHAGELIHEWVAAVWSGTKLSTLAGAIHVYPTLAEISKRAAGSYFAEKLFSERTKSILRLLFHLKGRACMLPEDLEGKNR
jgi:pyruvate/2-oxoglutarate dehydrogenase complex dihydrolipoamide dehydrogenase (E3) component